MSVLPTFADLPIAAPLKVWVDEWQGTVRLNELTAHTLLHIRGNEAEAALQQAGMKIGGVAPVDSGMLVRLRRDEFLLLTGKSEIAQNWLNRLTGDARVTATDIMHGRCVLFLAGFDVKSVLRKVCALDFSDAAFPIQHAAQTNLAKVRTLIIRVDFGMRQAYILIVDRCWRS